MNTLTVNTLVACAFVCLGALASCETEEPDPQNNNIGNTEDDNPTSDFTGDELAGFLALTQADKVTGSLPQAPDFQLKMNVKDTIVVMKGLYGARIVVRHNGLQDVSGFYVAVENSSYYYDVPVEDAQASDSTDVFYIDITDDAAIDFPFTLAVIIQPHSPDGEPLDQFERKVKAVDPKSGKGCPITAPYVGNTTDLGQKAWKWMHTYGIGQDDKVFHIEAPGLKQGSPYTTGGCCNDDGTSSTVADDPHCFEKFSDGTPNPKWRSIEVNHYFTWMYDILWFYDNGTFAQQNSSQQTNYRPSKTDFCSEKPFYDFDEGFYLKTGTHDFTAGTDHLTITYDVTDPPVYGKTIRSGTISYDCDGLAFLYEIEGQSWVVEYRKADPEDFLVSDGKVVGVKDWD
jgi:hypothetical protein